jgi:hypothetical protein
MKRKRMNSLLSRVIVRRLVNISTVWIVCSEDALRDCCASAGWRWPSVIPTESERLLSRVAFKDVPVTTVVYHGLDGVVDGVGPGRDSSAHFAGFPRWPRPGRTFAGRVRAEVVIAIRPTAEDRHRGYGRGQMRQRRYAFGGVATEAPIGPGRGG